MRRPYSLICAGPELNLHLRLPSRQSFPIIGRTHSLMPTSIREALK